MVFSSVVGAGVLVLASIGFPVVVSNPPRGAVVEAAGVEVEVDEIGMNVAIVEAAPCSVVSGNVLIRTKEVVLKAAAVLGASDVDVEAES